MIDSFFTQELIDKCAVSIINGILFSINLFVPYIIEAITDIIKFGIPTLAVILLIKYFGDLLGLSKREIKRLINFVRKIKDLLSGINSFKGLK